VKIEDYRLAVLIPCYNEEVAAPIVVRDFREYLPTANIYVYDNNSSDRTAEVSRCAGAVVEFEPLQGKGNVVRRMFSDIDADIYVLVDGDNTYDATDAPSLVAHLIERNLDMINAARVSDVVETYRFGHKFGNRLLTSIVASIFGRKFKDMLSGYRILSRRFVKSFPALSSGFEIETELTVHAMELRMPVDEVETLYKNRPENSESKLSTYKDGLRILKMIAVLVKEERPFQFLSMISIILVLASIVIAWPVITEYLATGLVPRFPTAILASGIMILAMLSFVSGIILDTVTHGRREMKRLAYLAQKPVRDL
jgi:glycosyltransferase involved in cell wall biosynthesis